MRIDRSVGSIISARGKAGMRGAGTLAIWPQLHPRNGRCPNPPYTMRVAEFSGGIRTVPQDGRPWTLATGRFSGRRPFGVRRFIAALQCGRTRPAVARGRWRRSSADESGDKSPHSKDSPQVLVTNGPIGGQNRSGPRSCRPNSARNSCRTRHLGNRPVSTGLALRCTALQ